MQAIITSGEKRRSHCRKASCSGDSIPPPSTTRARMSISHRERFTQLSALLEKWEAFWRTPPFRHPVLPWAPGYSDLVRELNALTDPDVERLQADIFSDSPLSSRLPVADMARFTSLPPLSRDPAPLPRTWNPHIGGRKWQQIEAFVAHVDAEPGQQQVDWCAGKGHLSRILSRRHKVSVVALEAQENLCSEGLQLAQRQHASVQMVQQDVLATGVVHWFERDVHVSALHACGALHQRLLEVVAQTGCAVTLAPCCYQRIPSQEYQPMSRLGRDLAGKHGLHLSREDLALAVQETITAPRSDRLARARGNAWRLGFDLLQRRIRGIDEYQHLPSVSHGRIPSSFEAFCRWAAVLKGLKLPPQCDWHSLEREGWSRYAEVSRLELVRHLFRRPLEIWLLLDRALFLEEAGFRVEIGTFCARDVTPRNLILRARPSAGVYLADEGG